MKVLFYINQIGDGGAERAICNTASYFAEHGWDTILLTSFRMKDEYSYSARVRRMSIEDKQIMQSRMKRNVSRIRAIRRICRNEAVDVVVSFMREPNVRALAATAGLKTKNIVSVRCDPEWEYRGKINRLLGRHLLPQAEGAVFQTGEARAWFPEKLRKRSAVIYNVVDDKFFQTEYKGGKNIVTVGRISPPKNHQMLIRSYKQAWERFPDRKLLVYGATEVDMGLPALVDELGLNGSVVLCGRCDDIPDVLSTAGLFVLSSDYEGLPNALMEAMAVGVPCISTDCTGGGARELFGEELSDLLTPVGDADALADKMIGLLSDDEKRREVGRKMRKRAEGFRTEKIGAEWVRYVESVCGVE